MKWKIATVILGIFVIWNYLIPTIKAVRWFLDTNSLPGWCDYPDGSVTANGKKRLGFDWKDLSVTYITKCPDSPLNH